MKLLETSSIRQKDAILLAGLWLVSAFVGASGASASSLFLAEAFVSPWVQGQYGQVRLIAASDSIGPAGEVQIGVQMRLLKGWKTYWRTPGESGIPTSFDWSRSSNMEEPKVEWPAPSRMSEFGSEAFGYKREVIFPITISRTESDGDILVDLNLSYGVCLNICIPVESHLQLLVPTSAGTPRRTSQARHIERFARKVPALNGSGSLEITSLRVRAERGERVLEVGLKSAAPMESPDATIELSHEYRMSAPKVWIADDALEAIVRVPFIKDAEAPDLIGQNLSVVAWQNKGRAVEVILKALP